MKLQSQFSLIFIPLLLFSGGGTIYFARRAIHKAILEEEVVRGRVKLEEVAAQSLRGFQEKSEASLLPILTSALTKQSAVYVMALDPTGNVLAHTNVLEKGKRYEDVATREALRATTPIFREMLYGSDRVLDLSWPIFSDAQRLNNAAEDLLFISNKEKIRLGTLRMGFPLKNATVVERRIMGQLTLILLLTDGALLGLAFMLVSGILRPVGRLVKATEEIAAGVYGSTVPVPSGRELAQLAKSFNAMSFALKQTTVSKDFLNAILANMLEPLIILHPDRRIRMVNGAALQMLGYKAGDLANQPAATIFPDSVQSLLLELDSAHPTQDREIVLKTKRGDEVSVLFSGSAFKDAEDRLIGYIIVAKDIRERKRMESEMLQSEKLSAVGRLASGVAHEINNPLGVILGFAQGALFDLKPDDPLKFPLESIEREAVRCRNLVQDLLTFSRVSKSEREPLALNKAVESACSLVTAQVRVGKATIHLELAPELPKVLANANQIQQIVINLANNALDAMPTGGTLTVKTEAFMEGTAPRVALSVIDTGTGIPADIVPRIFEPFFTTKPIGQGTGLGLGLVHEIVRKHDGRIEVESRPGRTCFCVSFPVIGHPSVTEAG